MLTEMDDGEGRKKRSRQGKTGRVGMKKRRREGGKDWSAEGKERPEWRGRTRKAAKDREGSRDPAGQLFPRPASVAVSRRLTACSSARSHARTHAHEGKRPEGNHFLVSLIFFPLLQSGVFCLFVSECCNRCWRSCIHVHVIVVVSAFVVPLVGLPVRLGVGGERGGAV